MSKISVWVLTGVWSKQNAAIAGDQSVVCVAPSNLMLSFETTLPDSSKNNPLKYERLNWPNFKDIKYQPTVHSNALST